MHPEIEKANAKRLTQVFQLKDTIVDYTLDKYQDYVDDIYNEPPEYSYYGSDRD